MGYTRKCTTRPKTMPAGAARPAMHHQRLLGRPYNPTLVHMANAFNVKPGMQSSPPSFSSNSSRSSRQVTSASPLPRVDIVTDKGLKSHSAIDQATRQGRTPSLASNICMSLDQFKNDAVCGLLALQFSVDSRMVLC